MRSGAVLYAKTRSQCPAPSGVAHMASRRTATIIAKANKKADSAAAQAKKLNKANTRTLIESEAVRSANIKKRRKVRRRMVELLGWLAATAVAMQSTGSTPKDLIMGFATFQMVCTCASEAYRAMEDEE